MANEGVSLEQAKSIADKLECSPSQHDASGFHGGKPNIVPTAKSSESVTGGTHLPTHTSELQMKDRSTTLPNYKQRFAHEHSQDSAHLKAHSK